MAKDRRIFGGYYQRYDGNMFFVVTVVKDYNTEEETVQSHTLLNHIFSQSKSPHKL